MSSSSQCLAVKSIIRFFFFWFFFGQETRNEGDSAALWMQCLLKSAESPLSPLFLLTVHITVQQLRISKLFSSETWGATTQHHSPFCCVLLVYKFFCRKTKWRWKVTWLIANKSTRHKMMECRLVSPACTWFFVTSKHLMIHLFFIKYLFWHIWWGEF